MELVYLNQLRRQDNRMIQGTWDQKKYKLFSDTSTFARIHD